MMAEILLTTLPRPPNAADTPRALYLVVAMILIISARLGFFAAGKFTIAPWVIFAIAVISPYTKRLYFAIDAILE